MNRQPQPSLMSGVRNHTTSHSADDVEFVHISLIYDSRDGRRRTNWNAILGIGLATLVSASFWAGVGLLIARGF